MTQNSSQLESAEKQKIVVLDDDRLSSHNLSIQLKFVGETPLFSTSDNWKQLFRQLSESGDLDNIFAIALGVINSYSLVDLLNTLHSHFPNLPLVLLNNQEEIQYSLLPESLQAKFLPLGDKSLNYRSLLVALQNARQLSGRAHNLRPSSIISETGTAMFRSLSGNSEHMQRVRQLMHGVAVRQMTALVIGESGTGKEIVARNLHYHSGRSQKPFIVANCSAVASDRHGVELFGQEKNFQGALESGPGLIEKAQGGTLFFDDIAELPLNIQGMLLRFLEDKKLNRMGGHTTITTDVRVVAATRYSLDEKIRQGNFRQDLYYRLSVVPIEIPPLRNHIEDIPDLIRELLYRLENKEHASIRFNSAAIQSLQQHSWPGNVRELANLVERMCIIKPNEVIGVNDLPQEYQYTNNVKMRHFAESPFHDQMAHAPDIVTYIPAQNTAPPLHTQTPVQLVPETAVKAGQPSVLQTQRGPDELKQAEEFSAEKLSIEGLPSLKPLSTPEDITKPLSSQSGSSFENTQVPAHSLFEANPVSGVAETVQQQTAAASVLTEAQPEAVAFSSADADLEPEHDAELALNPEPYAEDKTPAGEVPDSAAMAATSTADRLDDRQLPANNYAQGVALNDENLAMLPLNAERLEQYLENLERNLLEMAMLDSANIIKFAADRLKLDQDTLRGKLQKHGMA